MSAVAMQERSLTLPLEYAKLVAQIVSLVCLQLSVHHVTQDLILKTVFVLLVPDVLETN